MKDDDYTYENLRKMAYIDNVLKEVTRFYGPANSIFFREVIKDHEIKGVPLKKDIYIRNQSIGTHYSEKYFKNPT